MSAERQLKRQVVSAKYRHKYWLSKRKTYLSGRSPVLAAFVAQIDSLDRFVGFAVASHPPLGAIYKEIVKTYG
ncbi:MAG: hypothetical protein V4691_10230 [Pseudomonadota bacterium]